MMQKIFFGFALIVAVLSITLVLLWSKIMTPDLRPPKPTGHMEELIPMTSGKWRGEFRELGETEEVIRASVSLLAVTEFLSRTYTAQDGRNFTLYISYWAQGKEPTVRAASHIPDNCWLRSGAKIVEGTKKFGEEIELDGKKLLPFYERVFSFGMHRNSDEEITRNVRYWFVIEDEVYEFGDGDLSIPSPMKYISNMIYESRKGIPEQYFIRVDTLEPLDALFFDEDFKVILKSLGELILFQKNASEKSETSASTD
jgi:Protein of unknown function (DUF3485).